MVVPSFPFVQHHVDAFVFRQVQVPGTHIAGSSYQWPPVSAGRTTCVEPVRSIQRVHGQWRCSCFER